MTTKAQLAAALEEKARRKRENRLRDYAPYPKQAEFHAAGANYRQRLFMAGNQLGKTLAGSAEFAMHLTGRYPDDWKGHRYNKPIRAWASGVTGMSTRDNPQRLLLGSLGAEGTGMVPKDCIEKISKSKGTTEAVDTALIKHVSGGLSQLSFKSYELGREKWQGESLDLLWFDEEPPIDIYSEGLARLSARKGKCFITFTPLMGMSDVVILFLQDDTGDRHVTTMRIDEAEHISEEDRAKIIAAYPRHEREARANGVPMLGSGRIFPIEEELITCAPFKIPPHWPRLCALDFGVDHPTAAVWLAWDRDTDSVYVYDGYRNSGGTVAAHAAAVRMKGKTIPVAWPHDGLQRDKVSCRPLAEIYKRDHGLNMLPHKAEFEGGGYGVEAGLAMMLDRMETGRFKVFSHLTQWFEEFRLYHRKDGLVVKLRDDLMSATRIGVMMLRYAKVPGEQRWQPIKYPSNFEAGIV